jgi:hypothetical protein
VELIMQIKPLTEEEKRTKLAEMRQKVAEKRAAQAQVDAKENRANDVSLRSVYSARRTTAHLYRCSDVKPART